MTKDRPVKNASRNDLQMVAVEITSLNDALQAIAGNAPSDEIYAISDMIELRAKWLNSALDSVNAPQVAS